MINVINMYTGISNEKKYLYLVIMISIIFSIYNSSREGSM